MTIKQAAIDLIVALKGYTLPNGAENAYLRLSKAISDDKWQGLTDEQKLCLEIQGSKSDVMLAELVERWLKEANHGKNPT